MAARSVAATLGTDDAQLATCSNRYLCGSRSSSRLLSAAHSAAVSISGVSHQAHRHRLEKHMLKKLFVTAAAATAMSIPLAGVAWSDPADPGDPNGNGIGAGGVPGGPDSDQPVRIVDPESAVLGAGGRRSDWCGGAVGCGRSAATALARRLRRGSNTGHRRPPQWGLFTLAPTTSPGHFQPRHAARGSAHTFKETSPTPDLRVSWSTAVERGRALR